MKVFQILGRKRSFLEKLSETVEQLANRVSELEEQPVQKGIKAENSESFSDDQVLSSDDEQESSSDEDQDPSSEGEQEYLSKKEKVALSEKEQETLSKKKKKGSSKKKKKGSSKKKKKASPKKKIKALSKKEQEASSTQEQVLSSEIEAEPDPTVGSEVETKEVKEDERKFPFVKDKLYKQKLEDIKKEVESLKESDQKNIWTELLSLQASNDYVVGIFDELLQDFDTVMNGYSKLGMQVEELDQIVNKKIKIEDDLEKLKEQVDKLDAYVYSGEHKPVDENEEKKFEDGESFEDEEGAHFVRGKLEKPKKMDGQTYFAQTVKNLMAMPEEKRAEIRKGSLQPAIKKVKPTTMKRAYEQFIKATREKCAEKEEDAAELELKGAEEAEKISLTKFQGEEGTVTCSKKFQRTVQAITLVQDMQRTQQAGRLVKAKEMKVTQPLGHKEEQPSLERLEIAVPPSQQIFVEQPKSTPGKATLLFGDDKAAQELKEQIVMYFKSRLEETERKFMDKINTMEISIVEMQNENKALKQELDTLKNRLAVGEANQNKFEGKLTIVEEKTSLNNLHIEEMMIDVDKKADRSDVMQGMDKRDISVLEDRMLEINETTLLDIEGLRSFLKDYTVKLRYELEEKVSGFDMDCRLEPLAGRLKQLERMLKDVSLKVRVLECQTMGPISVKRYMHCEDGKRIKPLKPVSNWTSAVQSEMSIYQDRFFDEEIGEKIEADVQKRLEDAISRDTKHLIGGAHTKIKIP